MTPSPLSTGQRRGKVSDGFAMVVLIVSGLVISWWAWGLFVNAVVEHPECPCVEASE